MITILLGRVFLPGYSRRSSILILLLRCSFRLLSLSTTTCSVSSTVGFIFIFFGATTSSKSSSLNPSNCSSSDDISSVFILTALYSFSLFAITSLYLLRAYNLFGSSSFDSENNARGFIRR